MSRRCQITGRGSQPGNNVSHAHNISHRRFNVNLQKVRVLINGQVRTIRVSTRAIKSGLIERPPIKLREQRVKIKPVRAADVKTTTTEEQVVDSGFFSSGSVVDRVFQRPTRGQMIAVRSAREMAELEGVEFDQEAYLSSAEAARDIAAIEAEAEAKAARSERERGSN